MHCGICIFRSRTEMPELRVAIALKLDLRLFLYYGGVSLNISDKVCCFKISLDT